MGGSIGEVIWGSECLVERIVLTSDHSALYPASVQIVEVDTIRRGYTYIDQKVASSTYL